MLLCFGGVMLLSVLLCLFVFYCGVEDCQYWLVVVVFVCDLVVLLQILCDMLYWLFWFMLMEIEIVLLLVDGLMFDEVVVVIGIMKNIVCVYLCGIFVKMGVMWQVVFVKMLFNSVVLMVQCVVLVFGMILFYVICYQMLLNDVLIIGIC